MTDRPAPRTLSVPGEFPDLPAALAAAQPGDTVLLTAPAVVRETIRFPDGVTIEALAGAMLRGPAGCPVLVIEDAVDARISGLHLIHERGDGDAPLCEIRRAAVELRRCTFSAARGHGLLATEGAQLRLKHCAFSASSGDGVHLDGPAVHAEVLDCSACDNSGHGLRAVGGADAYMERFTARENGWGISAAGEATRVTCRMGVIESNRGTGLFSHLGAMLRIEGCSITANAGDGVSGSGSGTSIIARRNIVACNSGAGFLISGGPAVILDGNTCGDNHGAGISLSGPGTTVEIFANECVENGRGIITAGDVTGLMEDNVCERNSTDDFAVTAPALRLLRNRGAPPKTP